MQENPENEGTEIHKYYTLFVLDYGQDHKEKGTLKTSNWFSTVSSYKQAYFPIYRHNLERGSKCPPPPPYFFFHKILFFLPHLQRGS
jgi:hypothetical protein